MIATGSHSPIVRDIDVPPAVLRQLAAQHPDRYPALFDSAADGSLSRTSILVGQPRAAVWLDPGGVLRAQGSVPAGVASLIGQRGDFLAALEHWWLAERMPPVESGPPLAFTGGWVLFLGYELAQQIEPRLVLPRSALPWQAFALRVSCALVHDKVQQKVLVVAEAQAADEAAQIEAEAREAAKSLPAGGAAGPAQSLRAEAVVEEDPELYLHRVRVGKEYIRSGDIYQTNLARPWRVELGPDPSVSQVAALYDRLRRVNPAPFAALAQWRGASILSSSPERLVRVLGLRVDTRPIAGTRPRSREPGRDLAEMRELAAHPKERAEHIMLIDLERNDLGRVCEPGTVRVDELMTIESYAHVHHIVSNVTGLLRADVTPSGVLRAVFPGGTITGCPKFRCMEIIAELEGSGRGAYTGSLGFLNRDGSMDLNILIRTMTVMGRQVEFRAGAGIVADSDPERELNETRAKARGLLAVFEGAVQGTMQG